MHAMSVWRGIELEGRAFPAINISIGLSGFGDVENGVQGIQGFLVKAQEQSKLGQSSVEKEVLGKRKRDDSGIAKFFSKADETRQESPEKLGSPEKPVDRSPEDGDLSVDKGIVEDPSTAEMGDEDMYPCPRCHKKIPIFEMEEHEDYHVALDLSRGSPIRAPPINATSSAKPKPKMAKSEKRGPKNRGNQIEKGQRKLEFGI